MKTKQKIAEEKSVCRQGNGSSLLNVAYIGTPMSVCWSIPCFVHRSFPKGAKHLICVSYMII